MTTARVIRRAALTFCFTLATSAAFAQAAATQKPFEPHSGQAGKDVVWVPTPQALVNKMLDLAKVTPKDYLMDLGSGDGITVITAARRGVTALGIEYNPDMVALSQRKAKEAGVSSRATFVKADIFETDYSKATVITMFLLPQLNLKLRPALLELKPGTRLVSNTFNMDDWKEDESASITTEEGCTSWCTALLWIVPAKVEGTWQTPQGDLTLKQQFQMVSGTLGKDEVTGRLRGEQLEFTAGGKTYTASVSGSSMKGAIDGGGAWTASKR